MWQIVYLCGWDMWQIVHLSLNNNGILLSYAANCTSMPIEGIYGKSSRVVC